MMATFAPSTISEAVDWVRVTPRVLGVGGGTKPRLAQVNDTFARLSMQGLRGIVEYEPEEFTITALAGTPLREIAAALQECHQYLPFEPLFRDAGATLGGTVAAGTSGPGRFRFGGVRDFILGVRFIDGAGRLLRMGGKVVKNAAGFDLPKFFVGSLGRFGVLIEVTLKVFPRPAATLTLRMPARDIEFATSVLMEAARSRWQFDAVDLSPWDGAVCARLAGPAAALPPIADEILARWPGEVLPASQADALWQDLREARWSHPGGVFIKIAVTLGQISPVAAGARALGGRMHVSAGGSLAFISLPSSEQLDLLDQTLRANALPGVVLRGSGPLWLGARQRFDIGRAVKAALDAENRFPDLDD